jgi:abortive infection bacteriophage resistance protein
MNKNYYKGKQPTTFEEQIEILRSRNLIIDDNQEAINILSRVNYYRLSAYMLTLNARIDLRTELALVISTIYMSLIKDYVILALMFWKALKLLLGLIFLIISHTSMDQLVIATLKFLLASFLMQVLAKN